MEQKIRGLLSYLFGWVGGLIILLAFKDNNEQTKFNACQSIVLSAGCILIAIVLGFIPYIRLFLPGLVYLAMLVFAIIGMVKAYNEEKFEIPGVADLTKAIFKSQL